MRENTKMIKKLDYVPSWVDGARTLLEKINLCITKIENMSKTDIENINASIDELKTSIENLSVKTDSIRGDLANTNSSLNYWVYDTNKRVLALENEITPENLVEKFEGTDTVIVDLNENDDKIEIHLDGDIINKIDRALLLPVSQLGYSSVPIVNDGNNLTYKKISIYNLDDIYIHHLIIQYHSDELNNDYYFYIDLINRSSDDVAIKDLTNTYPNQTIEKYCGEKTTGQLFLFRGEITGYGTYKVVLDKNDVLYDFTLTANNTTITQTKTILY